MDVCVNVFVKHTDFNGQIYVIFLRLITNLNKA